MNFSENLETTIYYLKKVNRLSKNYDHAVSEPDGWQIFEPTKFIYSYFTFNLIYNIDWEKSFKTNDLMDYDVDKFLSVLSDFLEKYPEQKNDKIKTYVKNLEPREGTKRNNYLQFIDTNLSRDKIIELMTKNFEGNQFFSRQDDDTKKIRARITPDLQSAIFKLEGGSRIRSSHIDDFNKNLDKICSGEFKYGVLRDLGFFISQVRNNIFHGSKSITDMMREDQRLRLKLYTAIINGFNDGLFEIIEKKRKSSNTLRS